MNTGFMLKAVAADRTRKANTMIRTALLFCILPSFLFADPTADLSTIYASISKDWIDGAGANKVVVVENDGGFDLYIFDYYTDGLETVTLIEHPIARNTRGMPEISLETWVDRRIYFAIDHIVSEDLYLFEAIGIRYHKDQYIIEEFSYSLDSEGYNHLNCNVRFLDGTYERGPDISVSGEIPARVIRATEWQGHSEVEICGIPND